MLLDEAQLAEGQDVCFCGRGRGWMVVCISQLLGTEQAAAHGGQQAFVVGGGDEYKVMGLAPYGRTVFVDTILEHLVDLKEDGSVELNLDYFAFLEQPTMTNDRFAELFGGPARQPETRITCRRVLSAR